MNINYLFTILKTSCIAFEVDINGERNSFFATNQDVEISKDGELVFTDFIDGKSYILNNETVVIQIRAVEDILPSFIEASNYSKYIENIRDRVEYNNIKQLEWFIELKNSLPNDSEDSIRQFRTNFRL